ncbi:MAG TPA: hypothetical protein VGL51_01750 [Solirubrobacteraceae bacterium]
MSRATGAPQTRAEVRKLARILDRDPDRLAYLEQLPLADLIELRERVTDVLWSSDGSALNRLAAASKLLPTAVSAAISERAFGPLLSARLAAKLEPSRAVDVAAKLSAPFLADVAIELDPRRASQVIAQMPPRQIGEVTRELIAREEYVTMGRFVGHLSDDAVAAALSETDDRALLRVAFVLEEKERLEKLIGLLPEQRLASIVRAAADDELWLEALDLLEHLSDGRRSAIVTAALDLDPATQESIVAAVLEHDLWNEVLVIAEHDPGLQSKLARRVSSLSAAQRREVAQRIREQGSIERLGPLGAALEAG